MKKLTLLLTLALLLAGTLPVQASAPVGCTEEECNPAPAVPPCCDENECKYTPAPDQEADGYFYPIMPQPGENPRCTLVDGDWRCKPRQAGVEASSPASAGAMVVEYPAVVYDFPAPFGRFIAE